MPTPKDTLLEQLVINKLLKNQYDEADMAGKIDPTELYLVSDEKTKAAEIVYENVASKLKANDVQGAIDELNKLKANTTDVPPRVYIDTTLTKKGQAADAYATGKAITDVKNGTVENSKKINGYTLDVMAQEVWDTFTPQTDGIYGVYDPTAEV